MSTSAAQASAFFAEVIRNQQVFTVADDGGVPAPKNRHGVRAMPFWSLRSRAQKVVDTVPAYRDFEVEPVSLVDFRDAWLPDLESNGFLVGVNWSGKGASGCDLSPADVLAGLAAAETASQH